MDFELENKEVAGKYVLRTGKIFQAGEYPDKKFAISIDEIKNAVKDFKPIAINVEHEKTVWDGLMGQLVSIEASENGDLFGGALIPKAVDDLLGGKYKVSAEWSADKKLVGLGVVKKPRISDAALFAASFSVKEDEVEAIFAETAKTWDGRSIIQQIHDLVARHGAICDESNSSEYPNYYYSETDIDLDEVIKFVSKEESKTIQKLHDATIKAGAKCSFVKESKFSGAESGTTKRNVTMKNVKELKDAIFGLLRSMPDEAVEEKIVDSSENQKGADFSAENEALSQKIEELEAKLVVFNQKLEEAQGLTEQLNKLKDETKNSNNLELETYVNDLIGKKIYPAQKAEFSALLSKLAEDDEKNEFKFSTDSESFNRVELFKKFVSNFSDVNTEEKVISAKVLGNESLTDELRILKEKTTELAKQRNARFSQNNK